MLLSDSSLMHVILDGGLGITPFDPRLIQPASIDVRLGSEFRTFNRHMYAAIDPVLSQPNLMSAHLASDAHPFILQPGEFALGHTLESFALAHELAARLEGKSSLGRLGLMVHSTAGWIDPGFTGQVTLELSNVSPLPILLRPGMRIGQLCVMQLDAPAIHPYGSTELGSHYQGQSGATASRISL